MMADSEIRETVAEEEDGLQKGDGLQKEDGLQKGDGLVMTQDINDGQEGSAESAEDVEMKAKLNYDVVVKSSVTRPEKDTVYLFSLR